MLNYSLTLMNTYLKTMNCTKTNYFYEKDFIYLTLPSTYFHGSFMGCNKYQSIIYKNQIFHIGIRCIIDTKLDEILSISFYSKEINIENHQDIVDCIQQLFTEFSIFISENLHEALFHSSFVKILYKETLQKLQLKHQQLRTNKPLDINDIKMVDPSLTKDLPYHIYLIIYIDENKLLNISFMFDLHHQL